MSHTHFWGKLDAVFRPGDGVLIIRTQTTHTIVINPSSIILLIYMLSQAHAAAINIIMVFVLVRVCLCLCVCAVKINCGLLSCVDKKFPITL